VNQHERVEQAMAEHDAQAERDQDLARALGEIERSILLLAFHIERTFTDREQHNELVGQLDNLRHAVGKVEKW
jgi:homoserine acetyltransferase